MSYNEYLIVLLYECFQATLSIFKRPAHLWPGTQGKFIEGGCFKSDICLSPFMMEALGILEGMKLAASQCWNSIVVESDCSKIIEYLNKGFSPNSELGTLLDNIRNLSMSFMNCTFSFVSRSSNVVAHILARRVQWIDESVIWFDEPPPFLRTLLSWCIFLQCCRLNKISFSLQKKKKGK